MDVTKRAMMNVSGLDVLGFAERAGVWLAGIFIGSIRTLRKWNHRYQTRKLLLDLDDHILKDIGISRADAFQEGKKAFWKD